MLTRREFLEATVAGAAGLAMGTTAKSYERIAGANDRLNFAVIGLDGRAYALAFLYKGLRFVHAQPNL